MKALKDMANGGLKMIEVVDGLATGKLTKDTAKTTLTTAYNEVTSSQNKYRVENVAYGGYAQTGIIVLQPFFKTLNEQLNSVINAM